MKQTNTFTSGMNMDVDYALLKDNQYVYAENVRIVTNEGSSLGAMQSIEGFDKVNPSVSIAANETIIHTDSIRNYGIVFTESPDGLNHIYRFDFTKSELEPTVAKIVSAPLDIAKPVSSVCRWENEDYIKIYFSDGEHQIRVVNVSPAHDDYNKNVVPEELNITPNSDLPILKLGGYGSGSLLAGKIQYCYQLFKVRGSETGISPMTPMIRLSKEPAGAVNPIGTRPGEHTNKSVILSTTIDNTSFDKARIISIYYKDNRSMPVIKVVDEVSIIDGKIQYEDRGTNFINELTVDQFAALVTYQFTAKVLETKDNILFAGDITENTWDVEYDARAYRADDTGTVRIGSFSEDYMWFHLNDLTDPENPVIIPKEHDCIAPANAEDNLNYIYGRSSTGATTIGGNGINVSYTFVTTDFIEDSNTSDNGFQAKSRTADSVSLTLSNMYLKDVAQFAPKTYTYPLTGMMRCTPSYRDATMDSLFKSYQRDEVYRFGIVFYNDKNIASSVHWIGDIRMPHMNIAPTFETGVRVDYPNGMSFASPGLVTHPLGIKFEVRNIPEGVIGFEIVRSKRTAADRRIVSQGIISRVGIIGNEDGNVLTNEIRPYVFPTWSHPLHTGYFTAPSLNDYDSDDTKFFRFPRSSSSAYKWTDMADDVFVFYSPETAVMREVAAPALSEANSIETLARLQTMFIDDTVVRTFYDQSYPEGGEIRQHPVFTDMDFVFLPSYGDYDNRPEYPAHAVGKYYTKLPLESTIKSNIDNIVYAAPIEGMMNPDDLADIKANAPIINNYAYSNMMYTLINKPGDTDYRRGAKVGLGAPSMVIHSEDLLQRVPAYRNLTDTGNDRFAMTSVPLCNLTKPSAMYGGISYTSRQNSTYIPIGAYTKVKDDTTTYTSFVFGGDTYINLFDFANTTFPFHPEVNTLDGVKGKAFQCIAMSCYIPIESSINLMMRYDEARSTYNNSYYRQNNIISIAGVYAQPTPLYAYNEAYSTESMVKQFVSNPLYSIDNLHTDFRIIGSEIKTNLEVSDSWTKFRPANFLDLDSQHGSVNNLVTFNNILYFWQDSAFGQVSVNERSLITDNNPGSLVLGVGDVLTRYDYISVNNGSKDKDLRNVTISDNAIYWYDADRAEICGFDGSVKPISKMKGVQSYMNEGKNNATFKSNPNVVYDKKYNEILFTLDDNTLVYSEQSDMFTSFYTIDPDWYFTFTDKLYTFKNKNLYKYNAGDDKPLYFDDTKWLKMQFVVNDTYAQTKTFDNVEFSADSTHGTNLTNIVFETKRQRSFVTTSDKIDYREDTYMFAIPRSDRELNGIEELANKSYRDRMKGKYLLSTYYYDSNNGNIIKVPYISTIFRASLI